MKAEKVSPAKKTGWHRGWMHAALAILLGALLLLWPTLLNRSPFFLSDTTNYVRSADAAMFSGFGIRTDWTQRFVDRYQQPSAKAAADPQAENADHGRPVTIAGRSIYYGAFLYFADRIAGLRFAVLLQALLAAACLFLTVERFDRGSARSTRNFLLLTAALSIGSSLAYFAGYLMPDIFAGLGILAAAHLLCRAPQLTRHQAIFWFAMLGWSALTHSSNILILLIVAAAMLIGRLKWRAITLKRVAVVACGIAVGIVGELLFFAAVQTFSGDAPVRPPFLSARLIADGPGRTYLEQTCPGSGFALCAHLGALSGGSDTMLWSDDPNQGIFAALPNDERRRVAREDSRFVASVFAQRPLDVVRSAAGSVALQAGQWHLGEFNMNPGEGEELKAKLPPRVGGELAQSLAFRGAMPVRPPELLSLVVMLISLGLIARALLRRGTDPQTRLFLAIILIGIAADIAVCGAMSTPHNRYSMRVLWLLPLGAFLTMITQLVDRQGQRLETNSD